MGIPLPWSCTLATVETALNRWLLPSLTPETWDNVGLLLGSGLFEKNHKTVKRIFLCNDLTTPVLDEALALQHKPDLILPYHPPLFKPLTSIAYNSWKERIVSRCIGNDICVYSPHTCLDAIPGGINDEIIQLIDGLSRVSEVKCIGKGAEEEARVGITFEGNSSGVSSLFHKISNETTFDKIVLGFNTKGLVEGTGEKVGLSLYGHHEENHNQWTTSAIRYASDLNLVKSQSSPVLYLGPGRQCKLQSPVQLLDVVDLIKQKWALPYVQLAFGGKPVVSSVGVCAGSGGSLLKGLDVDLLITGEMSHHDILDCVEAKRSVILTGHCNSERHYLPTLAATLEVLLGTPSQDVPEIIISQIDRSPLTLGNCLS